MTDWDRANLGGKIIIICEILWPFMKDMMLVWIFVLVNMDYKKSEVDIKDNHFGRNKRRSNKKVTRS